MSSRASPAPTAWTPVQYARRHPMRSEHIIRERACTDRSYFGMSLLRVYTLSGKIVPFHDASNVTVWQLKAFLKGAIGVPKRQQRLFHGAEELPNHIHIDTRQDLTLLITSACHGCGIEANVLKVCSRCLSRCYCSERCQHHDWQSHKHTCVHPRRLQGDDTNL